jgi:hypothetical protein
MKKLLLIILVLVVFMALLTYLARQTNFFEYIFGGFPIFQ